MGSAVGSGLGLIVFIWARKERAPQEPVFTKIELFIAIALVVISIIAIWMLFTGALPTVYKP